MIGMHEKMCWKIGYSLISFFFLKLGLKQEADENLNTL